MKSLKTLLSFSWYCITHPHDRFWQALCNFSGASKILYQNQPNGIYGITENFKEELLETFDEGEIQDTYYWE